MDDLKKDLKIGDLLIHQRGSATNDVLVITSETKTQWKCSYKDIRSDQLFRARKDDLRVIGSGCNRSLYIPKEGEVEIISNRDDIDAIYLSVKNMTDKAALNPDASLEVMEEVRKQLNLIKGALCLIKALNKDSKS